MQSWQFLQAMHARLLAGSLFDVTPGPHSAAKLQLAGWGKSDRQSGVLVQQTKGMS